MTLITDICSHVYEGRFSSEENKFVYTIMQILTLDHILDHSPDHIPDHIPDHTPDHILDHIFDHIIDHYF
ncbi:hypothetical protein FHG87_012980 [Trinorchestia longiramus]|nr:hypothetical protein FHG87_012980 [Trinorchestia longiramus]